MTTIQEVSEALRNMNNELANEWSKNDIIKKRIATGYDDWKNDIHDHKLFLSLTEYIETCLDDPRIIGR